MIAPAPSLRACVLATASLGLLASCGPAPAAGGGEGRAAAPAQASPRAEFEAIARRLKEGANPYFGTATLKAVEEQLASPALRPPQRFDLLLKLATHKLRQGDTAAAVALVEEAGPPLQATTPERKSHPMFLDLQYLFHMNRALANMRHATVQNCVMNHNPERCILPFRGAGVHSEREPGLRALSSLREALRLRPDDLEARWLLNIAAQYVGSPPGGVPPALRIDFESFQSEATVRRFVDVAPDLGVGTFNLAGGVVVEDFDGDGLLDIVTSTCDPEGPLTFYRSRGDGRFEDVSARSGADRQLGGLNTVGADYDNDGDPDVLVLRGGWLFDDGRIRKSLLRNNGDGTFSDVTAVAGLVLPALPTQAAAWGDFDNDGDLDLYVANEAGGPREGRGAIASQPVPLPCQLFGNNGDGTFTDVAARAGVTNDRMAKGVAAGDYDNDGDLDLYVSNIGENRLYRNNGDGTFTDVADKLGVAEPAGRSFATWFFDYDNDGWLDLYVGAYDATIADLAADHLRRPYRADVPRLYRNNGDGTFRDVARQAGLGHPYRPMGANFGDLDNDGFLDIYLGTGDPSLTSVMPNVMLRNDRGRGFQDVTSAAGLGHVQKGHGIAFADLDNDGDQDIYHQLGGFYPVDRYYNAMFLNPGASGRFLYLTLVGVQSVRSAVGARIRVSVETPSGTREIHRCAGCVSSFGGSPVLRQEIGLGDAIRIREVEIRWPRSGKRQVHAAVPLDRWVEIREGSAELRTLPLRRVPFPAPRRGSSGSIGRARHDAR